jgi:hypothetical protein
LIRPKSKSRFSADSGKFRRGFFASLGNADESGFAGERRGSRALLRKFRRFRRVEEMAKSLNLRKVETITKSEFFEFDNGEAFINAPLSEDFLFPGWFDFLTENEKERVNQNSLRRLTTIARK